jgi:hypothetical protein
MSETLLALAPGGAGWLRVGRGGVGVHKKDAKVGGGRVS